MHRGFIGLLLALSLLSATPVRAQSQGQPPGEAASDPPSRAPEAGETPSPEGSDPAAAAATEPESDAASYDETPTADPAAGPEAGPASTATPPPRPAGTPDRYYAAPAPVMPEDTTTGPVVEEVAEPTAGGVDPADTLAPRHAAPSTALWAGLRGGWFMPFGTLWNDGFVVGGGCCVYERRSFTDYASSGPLLEIDVGARLSRRYNVFALWERASVGAGNLDPHAFGGQQRGWVDFIGAGVRFSTNPDDLGFILELALGYRAFTAYWKDGTELRMRGGMFDARIGIGADIRLAPYFALTPMLTLSSGSFGKAYWTGPRENGSAVDGFDSQGQSGSLTLQLGGHFDIY